VWTEPLFDSQTIFFCDILNSTQTKIVSSLHVFIFYSSDPSKKNNKKKTNLPATASIFDNFHKSFMAQYAIYQKKKKSFLFYTFLYQHLNVSLIKKANYFCKKSLFCQRLHPDWFQNDQNIDWSSPLTPLKPHSSIARPGPTFHSVTLGSFDFVMAIHLACLPCVWLVLC